ncbi:hypothetical protein ACTFIR_000560 [Dictyostelium discoideum]
MKFLSTLVLLLSVLALVRGEQYNKFTIDLNGVCTNSGSLDTCTNQCGDLGGSFEISQSGSNYNYKQYAAKNCELLPSISTDFTCLADEAPVSLEFGNIKVTCQDPSNSASSPLTTAVLFVVAFAVAIALLL